MRSNTEKLKLHPIPNKKSHIDDSSQSTGSGISAEDAGPLHFFVPETELRLAGIPFANKTEISHSMVKEVPALSLSLDQVHPANPISEQKVETSGESLFGWRSAGIQYEAAQKP